MRFIRNASLTALVLVLSLPVAAQTSQYTAPGGRVGGEPPDKEEIEAQMEQARWRLGPIRVAPWLALRGLSYESNVFVAGEDETSDVTGSLGAGLTAYLPSGENVFWIVQAMPEYLWWLDLSERNQLIGRYGAGVFADFNRLRLTVDARRTENQGPVSSESAQQVLADDTTLHVAADLSFSAAFRLAAEATTSDAEYRLPDGSRAFGPLLFSDLDREEQVLRGELVFMPDDRVEVRLGVERTDTEFAPGTRDRSSTGTSPSLGLRLTGNRLSLDALILRRELKPEEGSVLVPVEQTEGSVRFIVTPGHRLKCGVYGNRSTSYSLNRDYAQATVQRLGFEAGLPLGHRLSVRAYYESGDDDYQVLSGLPRTDDVTAYGLQADFEIGEWLSYRAGFQQVEYDSNLDAFDREYLRVTSSLTLSTGDWVWR
jgi:hypothetical protein